MSARQWPSVVRFASGHAIEFSNSPRRPPSGTSELDRLMALPSRTKAEQLRLFDLTKAMAAALPKDIGIAPMIQRPTQAAAAPQTPARRESALYLDARRRGWIK